MTDDDVINRVAVLKVLSDKTAEYYRQARDEADALLGEGDRRMVRSPLDGSKLGAVSKTDPKTVCRVADEGAFTQWMGENYPDLTRAAYQVIGTDKEVVAVLFEHAPHLLRRSTEVDPEAVAKVKQESVFVGAPVGPGGEVDVPGLVVEVPAGVVKCVPDALALSAVEALYRAGRLGLDGVVRELEGSDG